MACKLKSTQEDRERKVNKWLEMTTITILTLFFSIQLDENTTPAEEAKLIIYIYIQHTVETKLKQEIMQICKSHTTTPGKDMFCANTCSQAQPSL